MRFVSALLHIAAGLNLLLHLPAAEDAFYYGFRFRAGGAARRKQYALYSQTSLHSTHISRTSFKWLYMENGKREWTGTG